MVSHDLRGPLTVLRATAQLLHRRATTDHRAIETILRQADRMNRLIDDLSGIVQLETGTLVLNLQEVDLLALARREAEAIQAQTSHHLVRVESSVPAAIGTWDPERLGQVLQNVLDNAVKYSPEGGEILVRITSAPGEIRLSVSDQGAGIAPADLPRLFERYYRAHGGNHTAGLGLGLYIARMLVEAHGGRIWAESTPGQGSTFTIALPHS
jgi:signal transduction histidine kinase